MLSSSSVRPNQSSQGNTQHTPSGPVTSTLSRYQSLPSSVCVWLTWQQADRSYCLPHITLLQQICRRRA